MIRFRQKEDERRYLLLRSEVYRRVAGLPPGLVSEVMRNFGKLEQLLQLEGIRQGLAVAELSAMGEDANAHFAQSEETGVRHLKAFQAHAEIYGSSDTPLVDVEQEWLQRWKVDGDSAWLDPAPMRYAPATLAEWESEEDTEFSAGQATTLPAPPSEPAGWEDGASAPVDSLFGESLFGETTESGAEGTSDSQERPDMLDQVREHIRGKRKQGWEPKSWEQLILDLHLAMHVDAAFLDIQLSTQMGATVLAQAGIHLNPGLGIHLEDIRTEAEAIVSSAAAAKEQGEADGGSASEDDGAGPGWDPASTDADDS
jgi:hypothetical protein